MHAKRSIMSLRPVAAAVLSLGVLASGHAVAGEDTTPLSLTVAQYLSHDSNFSKDDSNRSAETVGTTVGRIAFDKSYGRQTYRASAKLSAQRYKNFDQLNNDGKDVNGSFTTELLRDWLVNANGTYSESLNTVQDNVGANRLVRNIRKYRDGGLTVRYGNGGTWAVEGSYDSNRQSYSLDSQRYQNANQTGKGLRVIYFASDVLNYSLGMRRVETDYPLNTSYSKISDRNIDLSTSWQVTGLSNLNATFTRRSTSYTPSDISGNSGWTGSLNWGYTPHGIVSYNVGFSRATGTDRQKFSGVVGGDNATFLNSNNTVTTNLVGSARAQLTGKLTLNVSQTVTRFKVDRSQVSEFEVLTELNGTASAVSGSYYHASTISMDYAAMRSLSLGCSYQRYSQGKDVYRRLYHGNSIDCNANFTID